MINRNKDKYSMFDVIDPPENYPEDYALRIKKRFIELCNIILYSDNQEVVARTYNVLFREYRTRIIAGSKETSLSIFEEVIDKLINTNFSDNDLDLPEYEIYSPFKVFLSIVKEQTRQRTLKKKNKHNISYPGEFLLKDEDKYPLINLQKYLYRYSLENMVDEKNEYINKGLRKTVVALEEDLKNNVY